MNRKYHKILALGLALMLTVSLTGCGTNGSSNTASDESTGEQAVTAQMVSVDYVEEDLYADWDDTAATHITLDGESATVSGNGAKAEGGGVTITDAGTYVLTGVMADGQIRVDAGKEDIVRIVLNDASLSCIDNAPIYVIQCKKTILTLADGTENSITDGSAYTDEAASADEPDAAIFSKDNLTINGSGSLTVAANFKDGIRSKDRIVIAGGKIEVTAVNDGIKGRDSVAVCGGTITINAGGDGIQANNDEDAAKGWVSMDGGEISITAGNDGIQAETVLQITDGDYLIQTGGGSANASTDSAGNRQPGWGNWGNPGEAQPVQTEDTPSAKGIKAASVFVTGGTLHIDSSDDCIHANGDASITSGELTLSSGDDGIHADNALAIWDGTIEITQSYEGLEGSMITVGGGTIRLSAKDDGLNAAGGNDGSSINDRPGQNAFEADADVWIRIKGGYLYVDAGGDGVDSNGNLYVEGGTVIVNGPTDNGNGPVDYNGEASITGGLFIAAGSSGMAQNFKDSSTQNSLLVCFTLMQKAGTTVNLSDESGNVILSFTPVKDFQSILISTPELKQGSTYVLSSGGTAVGDITDGLVTGGSYSSGTEVVRITLSKAAVSIMDTGEEVTGGFGPGGMKPGGMPQEGGVIPGGGGGMPPDGMRNKPQN